MTDTSSRQPIFNVPRTIVALIVVMTAIHAGRSLLSEQADGDLLARLAFVPARLALAVDPHAVMARLSTLAQSDPSPDGPAAVATFFLGAGTPQPWTLLSYAFLHGNWSHLGLNAIWLLAFGAPVAQRLGPVRFLSFFALSSIVGALTHAAVDPVSFDPLIGASAAVSGCMGAALRFMFQPRDPVWRGGGPRPAHTAPRRSLWALTRDRRVMAFAIVWFVTNLVTGIGAVPLGLSDMPIAWQAHVGGFLFGLLAFPMFDRATGHDGSGNEPDVLRDPPFVPDRLD